MPGETARDALTAAFAGKTWTCDLEAKPDRYGRRVGTCRVGTVDVQSWLVRRGLALDYRKYSGGAYARDQDAARVARRGLWSGAFIEPSNWRHRTCATTILGAVSVPVEARDKLCR